MPNKGIESFWAIYEGGLGTMSMCAGMTEKTASEMILKLLQTGITPWIEMWHQDGNRKRTLVHRYTEKDLPKEYKPGSLMRENNT